MTAFRAAFKAYRMHQVLILPRFARLTFALGLATAVFPLVIGCVQTVSRHFVIQTPVTVCQTI